MVRGGDTVNCTIAELQPLRAGPEDIALDIVYEDDHVLVVNKPAHMVRSLNQLLVPFSIHYSCCAKEEVFLLICLPHLRDLYNHISVLHCGVCFFCIH